MWNRSSEPPCFRFHKSFFLFPVFVSNLNWTRFVNKFCISLTDCHIFVFCILFMYLLVFSNLYFVFLCISLSGFLCISLVYLHIFVWVRPEKVAEESCVWHVRRSHNPSEISRVICLIFKIIRLKLFA